MFFVVVCPTSKKHNETEGDVRGGDTEKQRGREEGREGGREEGREGGREGGRQTYIHRERQQ